jgi:thymidylate kinase
VKTLETYITTSWDDGNPSDRQRASLASAPAEEAGLSRTLLAVFEALERADIAYCVTHGYEGYPQRIKSDVDCIVSPEVRPRQLAALLHDNRIGAEVVCVRGAYFVLAVRNADRPRSFLDLDFSADYQLGDLVFVTGELVLDSRRRRQPLWVPAPSLEFACYLIRRVVKSSLNDEQGSRLSALYWEDPAGCRRQVTGFWGVGSAALILDAASSGDWGPVRRMLGPLGAEARRHALVRHPWRALGNWSRRTGRRARLACRPEGGLDIIFLGVDGAGKSSVIRIVHEQWAGAFARTADYSFPPRVLGRLLRRPQGPPGPPHAEPPRSFLASVTRAVGYWFVYSTLGYYVTVHPAVARSTLVLHDRHLVDALVDPLRYRYTGPLRLLRLIWRLVPKPDLVILLDADPEVLEARKRELPLDEMVRQRAAYVSLVRTMTYGHIVDAGRPLKLVVDDVNDIILRLLDARIARRFGLAPSNRMTRGAPEGLPRRK